MNTLLQVLQNAALTPDRGIIFINGSSSEEFVSYGDLYEQALRLAAALQHKGVDAGDEIVFQIADNRSLLTLFWACILIKAVPVPLSLGTLDEHYIKLAQVWKNLRNPLLIYDSVLDRLFKILASNKDTQEVLPRIEKRLAPYQDLQQADGHPVLPAITGDDLAYIQFSSGSTAQPKGVALTHHNLVANTSDIMAHSHIGASDRLLSWMPLTHDMGMICAHLTGVRAGIDQYIMPVNLFVRRPLLWLDLAHQHKISLLYSPNFGYQYLLQAMDQNKDYDWDLSAVRLIYNGAEPISLDSCSQFCSTLSKYGLPPAVIYPGYGLAEASVAVTLPDPGDRVKGYYLDRRWLKAGDTVKEVTAASAVTFAEVGKPLANCQVRICNNSHAEDDGVIGEIQIKGANVTKGYYNNSQATSSVLTEDGWLKTGDLGFVNKGRLIITGRIKNLIIVNGQNYYPQDIERVVQDMEVLGPGKVVACAARHPEKTSDELLIFVLYKDSTVNLLPLIKVIHSRLINELGIDADKIIPVKKIHKTTSGKIQHHKFVEEYQKGTYNAVIEEIECLTPQAVSAEASATGTLIDQIMSLVQEMFPLHRLSSEDNLFHLGLNSLMANLLVLRLQKALGSAITISQLFDRPTVAGIAETVRGAQSYERAALPKTPEKATYELAALQKKFWFMQQLPANNGCLNLYSADEIIGALDIQACTLAFNAIIDRHESLRSTFRMANDGLVQKIHQEGTVKFRVVEYDLLKLASKYDALQHCIKEEVQQEFDLQQAPLLRGVIFKMDPDRTVFLFIIHHIVCDGWSIGLLTNEFRQLYQSYRSGVLVALPPLKSRYRDFCSWQQQKLASSQAAMHTSYWRQVLHTPLPRLGLSDRPNPPTAGFTGSRQLFTISGALTEQIQTFSKQKGITEFVVLITALHILFRKYTGQTDMVFGTDVAGRNHEDLLNNIGLYINTVILRTTSDSKDSFEDIIERVRTTVLGAFEHSDHPFENLVEELDLKRGTSQASIFDVLVLYQNFDYSFSFADSFADLTVNTIDTEVYASMVDLEFEFRKKQGSLQLSIRYNTDLFTRDFIATMGKRFSTLLTKLIDQQNLPVDDIYLLEERETERILANSQGPKAAYAATTWHHLFGTAAAQLGSATAIIDDDHEISYETLNRQSNRLAWYFRSKHQIHPNERIGLLVQPNRHMVVALLAILKSGAAYVPMDADLPAERIQYMAQDAAVRFILTDHASFPAEVTANIPILWLDDLMKTDHGNNDDDLPVCNTADDLAYIMYTSGSTGRPKGVLISHRSLADYIQTFVAYFQVVPGDRVLQQASLSFDTSIEEIFPALCSGAALVLLKNGGKDIAGMLGKLQQNKVTVLSTTPLVINELNHTPGLLAGLRLLIAGGDELKPAYISRLIDIPTLAIFNTYGPTECTVCATYGQINAAAEVSSIGRPIANREVYILDDQLRLVADGMPGEIYLGGAGLAKGYLHEEDNARFISHPFHRGTRLFKTGDTGKWNADGTIAFLGRKDAQVKVRGYRIELAAVEASICRQKDVSDAAVIALTNDNDEKYLVAYVTGIPDNGASQLLRNLRSVLPHYEMPAMIIPMAAFPLTASGKIDRTALPVPDTTAPHTDNAVFAPLSPIEQQLAAIWSEVLQCPLPAQYDNFFDSGGDSLKAMRLATQVQATMGSRLEFKDIFLHPTLAELAGFIQANDSHEYVEIAHIEDSEYYELSPAQHRLWVIDQFETGYLGSNMTWALEITGALDISVLEKSLQMLTDRHESLRTIFVQQQGMPVQKIVKITVKLQYLDLRNQPGREETISSMLSYELRQAFDLATGPLMRTRLLQAEDDKYLFSLSMHHIISDARSMKVLVHELFTLYNACKNNLPDPLPLQRIQYRDFAVWKNRARMAPALADAKTYFANQFNGPIPVLELPTDLPRPAVKTFNGDSLQFVIAGHQYRMVERLVRENSGTLFTTLLSAMATLLHKYSGQTDIIIGTPIEERDHRDLTDQIGLYINMLPLRCDIDPELSFQQLVNRVGKLVLNTMAHRSYPFSDLLHTIPLQRDQSRAPLFDVMLILLQEAEIGTTPDVPDGLTVKTRPVPVSVTQFDLTFIFIQSAGKVSLTIEFNTDLFTKARVQKMGDNFQQLLTAVSQDPAISLKKIEYISLNEQRLLRSFNNTAFPYPENSSVVSLFTDQVDKTPDAIALVCEETSYSYKALNEEVNRLSNYLVNKWSVTSQDVIGIMLSRSEKTVIVLMAISKAGACFVNVDHTLPETRIAYIINDAAPKLIIAEDILAPNSGTYAGIVININTIDTSQYSKLEPEVNIHPESPCYIVYTSGSTGNPKGVVQTFRTMLNLTLWDLYGSQLQWGLSLLQYASFSFDASYHDMFFSLSCGGKLYVVSDHQRLNFFDLKDYIVSNGIGIISFPYSVLSQFFSLVHIDDNEFRGVHHIISTGEQLLVGAGLKNVLERYRHIKLYNFYGPSETHVVTAYLAQPTRADLMVRPPIGKPIFNSGIHILDKELQMVPVGVPGDIYIAGDNLASGYLNLPLQTADRFLVLHVNGQQVPVYRSGDIGYWLDDGNIVYIGRADKQIKIRGHRIEPAEVEVVLLKNETVKEAVVVTTKNNEQEYALLAFYIPRNDSAKDLAGANLMKTWLAKHLPDYMVPSKLLCMNAFPLTPNGKVDTARLIALAEKQTMDRQTIPALTTRLQQKLAAIWSEVLHCGPVGPEDNFFELGGHSLNATAIIARVHARLNKKLDIRSVFAFPTISKLEHRIVQLPEENHTMIPLAAAASYELSFAQQDFWILDNYEQNLTSAHNMCCAYRFGKNFDPQLFCSAFDEVIKRHEILRTSFFTEHGRPRQRVSRPDEVNSRVQVLDWRSEENTEEALNALIATEEKTSFDLEKGPLLRATLLEGGDNSAVFIFTIHHIISDQWSTTVLFKDMLAAYNALANGNKMALPPLRLHYKDYSEWQQGLLASSAWKRSREYWLNQFDDQAPILELLTDYPRPAVKGFNGSVEVLQLDALQTAALTEISRETRSSLFMTLSGLVNALLILYTGQEDIVLGTPVAGRDYYELEDQIGYYVNKLAIRTRCSRNSSLKSILKNMRDTMLEAFTHQEYPFVNLVADMGLERIPSRSPLFDVMVVMEEATDELLQSAPFQISVIEPQTITAVFDLLFRFIYKNGSLSIAIEYNTGLFKKDTIAAMKEDLFTMIEQTLRDDEILLQDIRLHSDAEDSGVESFLQ